MAQGIKHIEIAVSDLQKSLIFYDGLFKILEWKKGARNDFIMNACKIYLKKWEFPAGNTLGVRHICLWGSDRAMVDRVGAYVKSTRVKMIRGPLIVTEYSPDYYTVDFFDPDGCMIEVAHTPQ